MQYMAVVCLCELQGEASGDLGSRQVPGALSKRRALPVPGVS